MGIAEDDGQIAHVFFEKDSPSVGDEDGEAPVLQEAFQQLNAYFQGRLKTFSLPLCLKGTVFQHKVWQATLQCPYGRTTTYKDLAVYINNPKASRAVGLALNKNPLPIFIPCHRVLGRYGDLTGYRGGLALKETLLQWERGKYS
ncbi:methylated-DNA--protein-cysteine methyltransferase [Alphaproteobacteria bacterium]|nr:methylated-DNA--protein-cysteine methyltransferase [Alphaproteobacteria bacterium]GHS97417.1 methylated-DNA--protein-cysteine methyltransferase [Alphaproteobacteria bacterium]